MQERLRAVEEQVALQKGAVRRAGTDHARAAAANRALQQDLERKRLRLDDLRAALAGNKRKLESDYLHLDSLEARERELEALRGTEAKRLAEARALRLLALCFCSTCVAMAALVRVLQLHVSRSDLEGGGRAVVGFLFLGQCHGILLWWSCQSAIGVVEH